MSRRSEGVVRVWHAGEGWGVIDSPDTPGGCRAAGVVVAGEADLRAGQPVEFTWEALASDGLDYAAIAVESAPQSPLGA